MRHRLNRILLASALAVAFALCGGELLGSRTRAQTSASGTWTLYPAQKSILTSTVRPPIKADGSSVFNSAKQGTIPVKFKLATAPGPIVFQSIYTNNIPSGEENQPEPIFDDDYSFVSFEPSGNLLFHQLDTLKATYSFTQGNCGGGSLRWSVTIDINNDDDEFIPDPENPETGTYPGLANDRSVFIYYGAYPNFNDCSGANSQSGVNMIGLSDLRYDTSQLVDGTFYDTYAHAVSLVGSMKVNSVTLALDSGWISDQKVDLSHVVVNGNEFTPLSGDPTNTCNLPQATINVTKLASSPVDSPISVQKKFSNIFFSTTNDCTYQYNLAVDSLLGAGDYSLELVIDSKPVPGAARFKLQ
ncbi:MAG: hypothetical protein ICV60_02080 [Pyrinomonadaceae bacterium]|nr:hypothetical protein [Pyrinomonadaceae bacterium]